VSDTRKTADQMDAVLAELDCFCAECMHNFDCETCPIDAAKKKMVWMLVEARCQVFNETLDEETIRDIDRPCRHLVVLPGGKH